MAAFTSFLAVGLKLMEIQKTNDAQKTASRNAKKTLNFQKEQADKLEADLKKQEEEAQRLADEQKKQSEDTARIQTAEEERDSSRKRQRRQAAGAQGRQDTILTSPLGVLGSATGKRKTLLGT